MPYCPKCGKEIQQNALFCPSCGFNLTPAAAPNPSQPFTPNVTGEDTDRSSARTLTLVAIIIQIVFFAFGLLLVPFFLLGLGFFSTNRSFVVNGTTVNFGGATNSAPFAAFGIISAIFGVGFLISIIWIVLDYVLIYRNLGASGNVASARTPSIVLGILQLIFGGVIPGILLIIAYLKIGDSLRRREPQRY